MIIIMNIMMVVRVILKVKKKRVRFGKKKSANSTPYSEAVTHPRTNGARRSLTSGSRRDLVHST